MDNWNPLHDDFVDPNFNSYNKGPGSSLPRKGLAGDGVQLYVGGIPLILTKEALCNLFSQAGKVKDVKILPTKNPGSLETFGFVTMSNLKEATDAITMLDRFRIDRFFLKVRPYKSKEDRQKWKKKKEEEEAFLLSLNQSKQHSQSGVLSTSDSDESFHKSKPTPNGVKKGDTRPKNSGRGRGLLKEDLSLTDLDNTNISKTPSTDSASSINSLADLTITVDQQLRQVRKGDTTSECNYSSNNSRSRGRGVTALQQNQNMTRGSNNQNDQSLTRKSLGVRGQIPVTPSGKPCLYCRKKACLLCTRCKMPYCSIDCQKADWPKHRISCSKISTMPKEINLDPDEFEVSVGEDIVEYLPSDSRILVKDCEEKLIASYQNEKREYESVNKNSPVKQSSLLNSKTARPKGEKTYGRNVPTLTQDLKPDQDLKIFIVLATSPEDFIVQIDEPTSKATLEALTNELYKVHEKQGQTLYMPEVGELVSCKYEDGQWYRGSVQQVTNASAIIYFLDFGNVSEIPLMRIRPGLSEHSDYPGQAIRCCLKNVKPLRLVNSIKIDDTFSETCLQNGCRFKAKICDITSNLVTLDLYDGKGNSMLDKLTVAVGKEPVSNTIPTLEISNHDRDISYVFTGFVSDTEFCVYEFDSQEKLVELHQDLTKHCSGVATADVPSVGDYVCALFEGAWYRAQVKSVQKECVSVYFVDYGNSSDVLIKNIHSTLPEHMKLPCQAIRCSFDGVDEPLDHETKNQMTSILQNSPINIKFVSTSNGVCKVQVILDGSNVNECLKQILNTETDTSVSKSTEGSSENIKIPPAKIPAKGEEIDCVFSGFVSDTEFCVTKLETLKQLIELSDTLTSYCTSTTERGAPSVGDYVCALYEGSWYRAQVKGVKGEMLTVYFVDYGNSEDVHQNDTRAMLSEHFKLPCQAIKCSLSGLEHSLNDKQRKDITAILEKNYFTVRYVTKKQDSCEVEIPSIKEFNDTSTDLFEEKPIPEQDYPTDGSHFGAIVTSCISDNRFCVLIKDQIFGLSKLMEQISVFCSKESESYAAKVGDYVCALYNTDGYWYRAKIVNIHKSGYQVYFVDYGNTDDVDKSNIRKLVTDLRTFPTQAIVCRLFGVKSVEKEFFGKLMTTHVQIEVVEQVEGINFVKVWLEDGSCVNDLFAEDQSEVLPCIRELPLPSSDMALTKDKAVEFEIQYIDSLSSFYIQVLHPNCKDFLEKIEQEILECCQAVIPYCPTVGEYVCCLYEGLWYRAYVNHVEEDVSRVNLIDYGNEIEVDSGAIRKFTAKLASFPPLAFQCCLDRISPDSRSLEKFAEVLTSDQNTKMKLMRKENGVNIVEIILSSGQCLSDLLCPNNPHDANVSDSPSTTVKAMERHTVDDLQFIVPSDSELTVIFTYVKDPFNIYCHSATEQGAEAMMKIQEMCLKVMAPYCEKSDMNIEPRVNELYCGKYVDDWYRCVVLELCEEKKTLVRFLDMGEEKEILVCDLRPILPEFLALPVSVFRCSLNGVKMFGDRWGTGASDLIRSICNETSKLNVVKRDNELLICDVVSCRGVNVSQELIKQCLAEEAVESIDNSPDGEDGEDDEDEEEILRKIAELQAKLTKKGKSVKS